MDPLIWDPILLRGTLQEPPYGSGVPSRRTTETHMISGHLLTILPDPSMKTTRLSAASGNPPSKTLILGVRIRGTLGDIDPLSKVPFKRAASIN